MSINKHDLNETLGELMALSGVESSDFHQARLEASIHEIVGFLGNKNMSGTSFHPEYIDEGRNLLTKLTQNKHIGLLKFLATQDVSLLQKYTEDDRKLLESIIQKSPLWFQIYAGIVTAEYYQTYIPETTNLSEEDNKRTVDYFHSTYIPSIQLWNKAREEQDIPLKEVRINESESMRLLESSIQLIKNHLKTSQESGIDICIAALWGKCYALLHTLGIPKESMYRKHSHIENIERIFEYIAGILEQKTNYRNTLPHSAIYHIIQETAELLEGYEAYIRRWQRYNKFQRYGEIDSESRKEIEKIAKNTANATNYIHQYEHSVATILSQGENPIIESLQMLNSDSAQEQNDGLLLLQSEPDILKYIATGEINSLNENHFYVEGFCTPEELPIQIRDKAAMLFYRIVKTFAGILPEGHFWGNEDDERKARNYYRKTYLPYISYREKCGDSLPASSGGLLQSELTRIFVKRLESHRHSNASQNYTNSAFLTLIQIIYHFSELGVDVDYDFGKLKIDAPSFSFFIERMLSNPTIKRSLEMLELEDGSNAYTYALSIYETLLSDEKSMHDIPVDTHTSHLITELGQRTKGNIGFQLHQWLQTIKKEG